MKRKYDVCLAKKNSKGEFIKNKDSKNVYMNWGSVVEDDNGYLNLVLETMNGPVWFTLFEVKDGVQHTTEHTTSVEQAVKEEFPNAEVNTDEIPF